MAGGGALVVAFGFVLFIGLIICMCILEKCVTPLPGSKYDRYRKHPSFESCDKNKEDGGDDEEKNV